MPTPYAMMQSSPAPVGQIEGDEVAIQTVKYFSGTDEVKNIHYVPRQIAERAFAHLKVKRVDGYSAMFGHPLQGPDALMPVTRVIDFKRNPSLHKCDARCRHAKGRQCECSCGGQFHGAGD